MEFLAFYKDNVKYELLNFKNNNTVAVERWLKMIDTKDFSSLPKIDYIVRALGSYEMTVTPKPLDKVGKLLADKLKAKYIPKLLSKNKYTQPLKNLGRYERQQEVRNSYICNEDFEIEDGASILIIDDVITTGSTGNAIQVALMNTYGYKIDTYRFALVYTPLSQNYASTQEKSNEDFYNTMMGA